MSAEQIIDVCSTLLEKVGVKAEDARVIGKSIAQNHLYGLAEGGAGGIQMLPGLVRRIRSGKMKAEAKWQIVHDSPALALINGTGGLGQLVCTAGVKMAMDKAKKVGVGAVAIYNDDYIGRVGQYTEMVAENNMIGIIYCGVPDPNVAPWGGRAPVIGTNPLSFGMPTRDKPIVVDFATSAVAFGKVMNAFVKGEKVPLGWIMDGDGKPTTDTKDYFGPPYPPEAETLIGAQLPAAQHKGYGLAMAVEILGNVLTGSGYDGKVRTGNGVFIQVINIESVTPLTDYMRRVDELVKRIKGCPTAPGFTEIMLPGEIEHRMEEKRRKEGIPIPDSSWQSVVQLAAELQVDLKEITGNTVVKVPLANSR